ncbi:MAG: Hpt domain-containing protein [Lachnospiraceae bacterium]|nr:Hpt domain-containing protein [Lachnospiraceae bacterium]
MITLDALKEYGADTETGLKRCMGNEALYLRLVGSVKDEPGFDALKDAIEKKDLDKAFDAAHALKGVLGNLSLTPLYDAVSGITEMLRARTDTDYSELLAKLQEARDELAGLCG